MEEYVDILDENGRPTQSTLLKKEAHRLGHFHATVHVWCYSKSGKILLHQRGKDKKTFPLLWDVSVAGHVSAGESIEKAALREVAEEIGIRIESPQLIPLEILKTEHRHAADFIDREFNHMFLCEIDTQVELTPQQTEVEALQWMAIPAFESHIENNSLDLVPDSEGRYQMIISAIKKRLELP